MADNFQDVAKQFVQFYYQQFDSDREQLAPLYRDTSMLTYESESMSGVVPIINKLKVRADRIPLLSGASPPSPDETTHLEQHNQHGIPIEDGIANEMLHFCSISRVCPSSG